MSAAFADTFFFVAALNPQDQHHQRVIRFSARFNRPMVTTEWILLEVANALADGSSREAYVGLDRALREDRRVRIVPLRRIGNGDDSAICVANWNRAGAEVYGSVHLHVHDSWRAGEVSYQCSVAGCRKSVVGRTADDRPVLGPVHKGVTSGRSRHNRYAALQTTFFLRRG